MDHMSNCEEIKSSENQPVPILEDPKGCLDIAKIHKKDDGIKETFILQQDPEGCLDGAKDYQKDVDIKKSAILQQDPKGCQDIAINHLQDDTKNTIILHQDPKGSCQDGVIREEDVISQQDPKGCQEIAKNDPKGCQDIAKNDPKGCQDIAKNDPKWCQEIAKNDPKGCQDIAKNDPIEKYGLIKETIILSGEVCPSKSEEEPADDDDGFKTPTSLESRIPVMTECPPAPKKPRHGTKRKYSISPSVQQTNVRV